VRPYLYFNLVIIKLRIEAADPKIVSVGRSTWFVIWKSYTLPKEFKTRHAVHLHCPLNSFAHGMHFSFDYAQQIFLPHNLQQVGPIYFLAPYKIDLFGIVIEPINHFVLYMIPELCQVGKGANAVISMLHHCLTNFSFSASQLFFNAANCVGQNKNRFLLAYLMV
jgi:hypothetical protein